MATKNEKGKPKGSTPSPRHWVMLGWFGFIFGMAIILSVFIIGFLLRTVTVHRTAWNNKADSTLNITKPIIPVRGDILASDGSILATNLRYFDARIDFRADEFDIIGFTDSLDLLCDSLAAHFNRFDREGWERHLRAGYLNIPHSKRSRSYTILRKPVPEDSARMIKHFPFFRSHKGNANYTGLSINGVTVRANPFGDMARLSIGRIGYDTLYKREMGISGLERALDSLLSGTPGLQKMALANRGQYMATVVPAVNGSTVTTTIDVTIQDLLDTELASMLLKCNAKWGTAMIMETHTGDIKAISNLERDPDSAEPKIIHAMNRIVMGYEPGSVMKVMSMAVAMHYGYAHLDAVYPIGRSYAYGGVRAITDTHSPATLPVSQFLEFSSNIGMVKLSMPQYERRPQLFKERLAELGFFDRLGTSMYGERRPFFPDLEVEHNGVMQTKHGAKIDLSRMVFGYTTNIPPLYTCAFYNAVANDGRFVAPRLVKAIKNDDGIDSVPVRYIRDRILTSGQARDLRAMMRQVVWGDGGTAKHLKNETVEFAGKTGTVKILTEKPKDWPAGQPFIPRYMDGHYRVTFCGFFPYENPKYTAIVVISDPIAPRGPAYTSGEVMLNLALKMHARGMITPDAPFRGRQDVQSTPYLHASFNNERHSRLAADIHGRSLQLPPDTIPSGHIPDVRGVCFRDALARLEQAGYPVSYEGEGYVRAQVPEPGTAATYGTGVHLTLSNGH